MATNNHPTPIDATRPSAFGVTPLFRYVLTNKDGTSLGYEIIDVVAVLPGVREKGSKYTFPVYVALGFSRGKWHQTDIHGFEGHEDLEANYEVVQ